MLGSERTPVGQGKPDIFNTDQGAQFTSEGFTSRLEEANIRISMDGRGRVFDNICIERIWSTVKMNTSIFINMKPYLTFMLASPRTFSSTTMNDFIKA